MEGDPLLLGQRLVAVLEDGKRTSTYKLAVMVALLDLAVESVPDDPAAPVTLDLRDLTIRVMDLYWRQLRPLDGQVLRQSTLTGSVVLDSLTELRVRIGATAGSTIPLAAADCDAHRDAFDEAVERINRNLIRYPLKLLQRVGTGEYVRFLYDDDWLGTDSKRVIAQHDNRIELYPGVCTALARLAPLVKPAFQLAWVDDVRKYNKSLLDEGPDLAAHLFGADRLSLTRPAEVLTETYGPYCFYCTARLGKDLQVDHVLPWSRVTIDGLANLVLSCQACNGNKSAILPQPGHVARALDRGKSALDQLADEINWPNQYDRVGAAAHGLYATQPESTPVWFARKDIRPMGRIDFIWPPPD